MSLNSNNKNDHDSIKFATSLLCPYEWEDPAFYSENRLPNLRHGDQIRALWVTRYDFKTKEDIVDIIKKSSEIGFNTIFFQVRGNATAHYESKIEPWSEVYGWQSPGFDPLTVAVQESHARNIALHAWINVMPMWRGSSPPSHPSHIYNTRPEWSWFDKNGKRQELVTGFYVSVNPCLNDVRKHIVNVCLDIVTNYAIDGLHFDYLRFPNEHPVVDGHRYPMDKATVEIFKSITAVHPDRDANLWSQFRSNCITKLLKQIRMSTMSIKPRLVLTSSVCAEKQEADARFQDVYTWLNERLLDAIIPMNYTNCHKQFRMKGEVEWSHSSKDKIRYSDHSDMIMRRRRLKKKFKPVFDDFLSEKERKPVEKEWVKSPEPVIIMGVSVFNRNSFSQQRQIFFALQKFGHFSIFCFSTLFSNYDSNLSANSRSLKEPSLLPFLQIISRAARFFHLPEFRPKLHPFQGLLSRSHPEETFPYDQLHLYEKVPAEMNLQNIKSRAGNFSKKFRDRRGLASNLTADKVYRRTWRRNLLIDHQKLMDARERLVRLNNDSLYFSDNDAVFGDTNSSCRPMQWDAVKMGDAIGEINTCEIK